MGLSRQHEAWGLGELLRRYPGLSIRPQKGGTILLTGEVEFVAKRSGFEEISDSYAIEIHVPRSFPRELPTVKETAGRIPRTFHTSSDETLCLGSTLRLFLHLNRNPTLVGFIESCLIPYLYGHTYKERHGQMPFGELAHGADGILQDCMTMFGVGDQRTARQLFLLLGIRKRLANRRPCPCGSGQRLGRCHNRVLNRFRKLQSRSWFRRQYQRLVD